MPDMDMALDTIVPETLNWRHTAEGPEYVWNLSMPAIQFKDISSLVIRESRVGNNLTTLLTTLRTGYPTLKLHWWEAQSRYLSRTVSSTWAHGRVGFLFSC